MCGGTGPDGVAITTSQSTVSVLNGATVLANGAAAISVAIPADGTSYPPRSATINVAGTVDGGSQAGISVVNGPLNGFYDYSGSQATITVTAGGSISGSNAIVVGSSPANSAYAFVSLDNSGTITGTAGPALQTNTYWGGFQTITNQAGGYIGGIASGVGTLNNAGTIDGGLGTAIASGAPQVLYGQGITNSGLITASGASTTITDPLPYGVTNSGTVSNTGTGSAISGGYLPVVNQQGGVISALVGDTITATGTAKITNSGQITNVTGVAISGYDLTVQNNAGSTISAGATAISASDALELVNQGTIVGDVHAGSGSSLSYSASNVDSTAGTITGNLIFGSDNDLLFVGYSGGTVQTGVNGTIDGGAGTDTMVVETTADTTIAQPVTLPTNFEQLAIAPTAGTTITLAQGFGAPGTLELGGAGTVVNAATLSGAGTIISSGGGTALGYSSVSFTNTGAITSAADGVEMSTQGSFANSGTITAGGTAASVYLGGTFSNSGTIRSTAGTGLVLYGYASGTGVNSGTIDGAQVGVQLFSRLENTGTITSAGTAVALASGTLRNDAGGVITGGTWAIAPASGGLTGASVINAGTINGDVTFGPYNPYSYGNTFYAETGGILNGNLTLTASDTLVTDVINTGSGPLAGINGTVTASGASLRYLVDTETTTALVEPAGFASVGYELVNPVTLTLSASAPLPIGLNLSGTGTVDLTADLSTTDGAVLQTTYISDSFGHYISPALAITSHGTLTMNRDSNGLNIAAVNLGYQDTLTNAGTIAVTDSSGSASHVAAVNGGTVVNTGIITNDLGDGIAYAVSLNNSGTITVGGAAADNVTGPITNSGTLTSTGGTAVISTYSALNLDNGASGTITGAGYAIQASGGSIVNAGTINGSVDLSYTSYGYPSYATGTYVAAGGTLNGNLTFGSGDDVLVETGNGFGVSGTITAGTGSNYVVHERDTTGTVTLGGALPTGFTNESVVSRGANTIATITSATALTKDILVGGDGQIVNQVDTSGSIGSTSSVYFGDAYGNALQNITLASFTNEADVGGAIVLTTNAMSNTGSVGSNALTSPAIQQYAGSGLLSFDNAGSVVSANSSANYYAAVSLQGYGLTGATIANSGSISGGMDVSLSVDPAASNASTTITNSGTITRAVEYRSTLNVTQSVSIAQPTAAPVTISNSGTIENTGQGGSSISVSSYIPITVGLTNSGTIRANAGGVSFLNPDPYAGAALHFGPETTPASAISVLGTSAMATTINNTSGGTIEATGSFSTAISVTGALTLQNAGIITGTSGFTVAANDSAASTFGTTSFAGAVQTFGGANDSIVNSGTIDGSIDLGDGNDTIVNTGTINGSVSLGAGDDSFTERASATLNGSVDGGSGFNTFIVDATGGGTITPGVFTNFERMVQTGVGSVAYSGSFQVPTIELNNSTLTVAAGTTLQTAGPVAVTGSGSVTVVNAGTILGDVRLGDGDDTYVDITGSHVSGVVDGGAGTNTYQFALLGDRTVSAAGTNFQQIAVTGSGTLSYALNQSFASAQLAGTGLNLTLHGYTIGQIIGSDAAESVTADGDLPFVSLGSGDDMLTLATTKAAGSYDGGAGNDTLTFATPTLVTLSGKVTGFETIGLEGHALTVTGTLGAAGDTIAFGSSSTDLAVGTGGTIAGAVQLGGGDNTLHIAEGGVVSGSVNGGNGTNAVFFDGPSAYTLTGTLTGFDHVSIASEKLTIAGSFGAANQATVFDDGGDLVTVAAGGSLSGNLVFGSGNDQLVIDGAFAGSVAGGAGTNSITVASGSQAAPVAFGAISNIESYTQSSGFATIAGAAGFGSINLTGGTLYGLARSTITAPTIAVGQAATFASGGTVNGNLWVAGTLAPLGTMTVNGNVALGATSITSLNLSESGSDKLAVSGKVTIAQGATLNLGASGGTIRPGSSIDLIVASDGLTGSFTNIIKPASLFGFVVAEGDTLAFLTEFQNSSAYSSQVQRSIAYANATLAVQPATSTLFAALPSLLGGNGVSNTAAFAQLTPESYATATQLGVQNGLELVDATRSMRFAPASDEAHSFTFGQVLGTWSHIGANAGLGTSRETADGYGFLGGLGIGAGDWAVGAFIGYLNDTQTIAVLGTQTKSDGVTAGVHARYTSGSFALSASAFYDGGRAHTKRVLPADGSAHGSYDLHGYGFDGSISARFAIGSMLTLTPHAGLTWLRVDRGAVDETGDSPFTLTVARHGQWAGFADAGVSIGAGEGMTGPIRPWLSLGVRYQLQGREVGALAGYAGGDLGLFANGAPRDRAAASASGGIEARIAPSLSFFASGGGDFSSHTTNANVTGGVRLAF